jgi:peptidoglycan/LPS O-acetylase OafA/YrhL
MTAALFLYALDAALAADLTKRFFLYLPDLGVGVTIFVLGILASRMAGRRTLIGAVNRGLPGARLLAALTRGGIVVLSSAVALDHVGIGRAIVPSALLILLGGVTLASALAVGLGSRDAVGRWINDRLGNPPEKEPDDIQHW